MSRRLAVLLVALAACGDNQTTPAATQSRLAAPTAAPAATATIAGSVIDRDTREAVGNVEVVLRGPHGDLTTKTAADGTFKLSVPRGPYRAFVRDPRVISTGMQAPVHLQSAPRAELVGASDDALMPVLEVDDDATGIDLTVTVGATIDGFVTDPNDEYLEDVVISAVPFEWGTQNVRRSTPRALLGTDTAVSDETGHFVLHVPAGSYSLVASHPTYAGISIGSDDHELTAGQRVDVTMQLERGCEVTGRIVSADKGLVHDGALETSEGNGFLPTGRVQPDGTFRWTTTLPGAISIRAWPWAQAPSAARTFACENGRRFGGVVLTLPWQEPDVTGTLSDTRGNPVSLTYLDITPLDSIDNAQTERTDAAGNWRVFELPAGRYRVSASAAGRGVVSEVITAPHRDIALRLSGTGRLAGTTTDIVNGSFELTFHSCGPENSPIDVDDDPRLVIVRGGRFSVDRVPACALTFSVRWRDRFFTQSVAIEPDQTTYTELALGVPRDKEVHGIVRDANGQPVARARVTALIDQREATTVRSDEHGRYTLETQGGAQLVAGNGKYVGRAQVGRANVLTEQVDISLVLDE